MKYLRKNGLLVLLITFVARELYNEFSNNYQRGKKAKRIEILQKDLKNTDIKDAIKLIFKESPEFRTLRTVDMMIAEKIEIKENIKSLYNIIGINFKDINN